MSGNSDNSFGKHQRLHSKKEIQELFEKGSSFYLYPFKILYLIEEFKDKPHQVLISVSKRKFKKSPDRNRVKRQFRESFRLQKDLIDPVILDKTLRIAYIYTADKIMPSNVFSKKLKNTLVRFAKDLQ